MVVRGSAKTTEDVLKSSLRFTTPPIFTSVMAVSLKDYFRGSYQSPVQVSAISSHSPDVGTDAVDGFEHAASVVMHLIVGSARQNLSLDFVTGKLAFEGSADNGNDVAFARMVIPDIIGFADKDVQPQTMLKLRGFGLGDISSGSQSPGKICGKKNKRRYNAPHSVRITVYPLRTASASDRLHP